MRWCPFSSGINPLADIKKSIELRKPIRWVVYIAEILGVGSKDKFFHIEDLYGYRGKLQNFAKADTTNFNA